MADRLKSIDETQPMVVEPDAPKKLADEKPMHVRLATPVYGGMVAVPFAVCVLQLQMEAFRKRVVLTFDMVGNESLIQRGRNLITARFLQSEADKLFFVDSDITFNPEAFLKVATSKKDCVGGAYAKKHIDWDRVRRGVLEGSPEPVAALGLDYNVNIKEAVTPDAEGLIPVLDTATGFLCLSRPLMSRMYEHYKDMKCANDIMHQGAGEPIKEYVPIFDCMIDPRDKRYLSEDYSLCRRIQQMGEKVWVDVTVGLAHIGNMEMQGDAKQLFESISKRRGGTKK